jgi:amphi-Trp domain-containing protein
MIRCVRLSFPKKHADMWIDEESDQVNGQNFFMDYARSYSVIGMAKLLGEPGKMSSGTGLEEFKQEFHPTKSEAATFLRDLAQEIESGGKVEATYGSWSISVDPTPSIKIEVEYEEDELEIEIKLKRTP